MKSFFTLALKSHLDQTRESPRARAFDPAMVDICLGVRVEARDRQIRIIPQRYLVSWAVMLAIVLAVLVCMAVGLRTVLRLM